MADKPILFSAPMVNAILRGAKTQTRRVIKPALSAAFDVGRSASDSAAGYPFVENEYGDFISAVKLAPYQVGDTLWVRETWGVYRLESIGGNREYPNILYRADNSTRLILSQKVWDIYKDGPLKWRSSIFMPRWASRITLRVTNVRAQRVQDISEDDAAAEGIGYYLDNLGSTRSNPTRVYPAFPDKPGGFPTARMAFEALWDSTNKKRGYSWNSNPWVFAYTFEVTA